MIIYQIDLKVKKGILDDYQSWLIRHIKKMMTFQGFLDAELCENLEQEEHSFMSLSVIYHIHSESDLQEYFKNNAKAMRDEGLALFGDAYQANRKIYKVIG